MPKRISTDYPLRCDCGNVGTATLEEDDLPNRQEGGQNRVWLISELFEARGDRIVCRTCEVRDA
jgi:hypothetical protein